MPRVLKPRKPARDDWRELLARIDRRIMEGECLTHILKDERVTNPAYWQMVDYKATLDVGVRLKTSNAKNWGSLRYQVTTRWPKARS